MTAKQVRVCERLKQLGFARNKQIKLYGAQFEVIGDPLMLSDDLVVVDTVEQNSGLRRRVGLPLMFLKIASEETLAA